MIGSESEVPTGAYEGRQTSARCSESRLLFQAAFKWANVFHNEANLGCPQM